jgi:diguanylate cyclase (GGDEF)-like protein
MLLSPASLRKPEITEGIAARHRRVLVALCVICAFAVLLAGHSAWSLRRVVQQIEARNIEPSRALEQLSAILELTTTPAALHGTPEQRDTATAARELALAVEGLPRRLAYYRAASPGADARALERASERWLAAARVLVAAPATGLDPRDQARSLLTLQAARTELAAVVEERQQIESTLRQLGLQAVQGSLRSAMGGASAAFVLLGLLTASLIALNARQASAGRRSEAAALEAGRRDALTQLPNRRALEADLHRLLERHRPGVLGLVKLERFTRVVHVYGPVFADEALVLASRRIATDLVALHGDDVRMYRLEGTMFAVLLPEVSRSRALTLMHSAVKGFVAPLCVDDHEVFLDLRIGLVGYPENSADVDALVSAAETALRFARDDSAAPVRIFDPEMRASIQRRTELEEGLQRACGDGSLTLHYHPQIEIASGRLLGVEALLRWRHPRLGPVSPAEFIPIAEEIGVINDIGRWVLMQACEQLSAWHAAGHPELRMSVNVSPLQLASGELPDLVADVIRATALPAASLELEITEGFSLNDMELMSSSLHALKSVGVRLAVDDFGTGYSSLSYLRQLPVDVLKIDRSFVRDLQRDAKRYDLVRIVIDLGHALGHEVVAEGIETVEELRALQWLGCDLAQGYLTCHPMSPEGLDPLLDRANWLPDGILPSSRVRRNTRLGRQSRMPHASN